MSDRVEQLRRSGSVAATGELTVDEGLARDKLQKFRLADPHHYVLQFVRAASLFGATRVEFEIDADEVVCGFDVPIPREMLDEFWSKAYGQRRDDTDEALYHLALGVASARALNPASVYVETTGPDGVLKNFGQHGEPIEPARGSTDVPATRIYVRERFRFGHLVEFFRKFVGRLPEESALREKCRFSTLDVRVNGSAIYHPLLTVMKAELPPAPPRSAVRVLLASFLPTNSVVPRDAGRIRVRLLSDGIEVGTYSGFAHGIGGIAVVESRALQTDLSSLSVIADEAYEVLIRRDVYGGYHGALLRYLRDFGELLDERDTRELLDQVALWITESRELGIEPAEPTEELFAALRQRPCFWRADADQHVSFDALLQGSRRKKTLYHSAERFPRLVDTDVSPVAHSVGTMRVLTRVAEVVGDVHLRDAQELLFQERKRRRNKANFFAENPRPMAKFPVYREVERGARRGRVYADTGERAWVDGTPDTRHLEGAEFRVQGRRIRITSGPTPFYVVIDGDFEPAEMYDDIVRDEAFDDLAVGLVRELPDLVEELAGRYHTRSKAPPERVCNLLVWWVNAVLSADVVSPFLSQLGLPTERLPELAARARSTMRRGAFGIPHAPDDTPTAVILRALGSVAHVRFLKDLRGNIRSLDELVGIGRVATGRTVEDTRGVEVPMFENTLDLVTLLRHFVTVDQGEPLSVDRQDSTASLIAELLADDGSESKSALEDDPAPPRPPSSPPKSRVRERPLLDAISRILVEVRGDRRDLFDDIVAGSFEWGLEGARLCEVRDRSVRLNRTHPLLSRVSLEDPMSVVVLASVVYGEVNRYYEWITDYHDLEMQRRLLSRTRDA